MKNSFKFFHITRTETYKERLQLLAIELASIFDAFVYILSLTFISSECREYLLFYVFDED